MNQINGKQASTPRSASCVPLPQQLRTLSNNVELALRSRSRGERIIGKRRESAIRMQQPALCAKRLDRMLGTL